MTFDLSPGWLEAVLLAGVRIVAFIVIAPPFSYGGFPARIKAMLAVGLGLAMAPVVTPGFTDLGTGPFLLALVMQALIGFALGFLTMLVFSAVEVAGGFVDLFGGFQLAQAFDPGMNINGAQFARMMKLAALALLFSSGAYQIVMEGLARTFDAVPLGSGLDMSVTAQSVISALTGMFVAALQIAGPLIIVLFLADVGLGLLTKIAPALNAFSMGFPVKILLTITLGGALFIALPGIVSALIEQIVDVIGKAAHV